jgi:hypothetical protein
MQACLLRFMAVAVTIITASFAVQAQDEGGSGWNHFGMDARLGFNIRAKFMNEGGFAASAPPPPAAGGAVNRNYNDGFVNADGSGNAGGRTWNWGYQHASQAPGNDTLLMHADSVDGATSTRQDDPSLGFELSYLRDFAHEDWGNWGVKFAFGYCRVNLQDNQPQTANVTQITDTYALGGIQVPLAPYNGSFNGPGAVIGGTPTGRTTTVVPGGATVTGNRGIDATLYDFRLGPNAEFKLLKRLSLQLSGGLALGVADSTFSFSETTATAAGVVSASGSRHDTGFLVGAYAEAGLAWRFWRSASVFAGVEFQYLGDFQQNAADRISQLDLGQAIFCKAGLQWRF